MRVGGIAVGAMLGLAVSANGSLLNSPYYTTGMVVLLYSVVSMPAAVAEFRCVGVRGYSLPRAPACQSGGWCGVGGRGAHCTAALHCALPSTPNLHSCRYTLCMIGYTMVGLTACTYIGCCDAHATWQTFAGKAVPTVLGALWGLALNSLILPHFASNDMLQTQADILRTSFQNMLRWAGAASKLRCLLLWLVAAAAEEPAGAHTHKLSVLALLLLPPLLPLLLCMCACVCLQYAARGAAGRPGAAPAQSWPPPGRGGARHAAHLWCGCPAGLHCH